MPRKDLPSPNARNFPSRVREEIHAFMGRVGDGIDRALTLREMIASGLLTQGAGGGLAPGPATEYEVDLTPPPPPSNLQATTSGNSILVTINPQTYRQGNGPGTVTIYGAKYMAGDALPVFADAAVLDEFPGDVHSFPVDPGALYRIWAKSVSRDGVPSEPAGGTNGVEPVPGLLDDVSIASLTASRIRSGSVTVGQFIQAAGYVPATAGWRINGDGTAEFSQVVVRGTIFASQGAIGGWTIGSNYLQSTTYALGTSGTRLNSDGTGQIGGITIYSEGLGAGSTAYDTGAGAWIGRDGRLSLRNSSGTQYLKWDGSSLQISGALQAATGTFAGSLSAATGTFSGALSAATGTFSGSLTASAVNAVNTINLAGQAVTIPVGAYTDGASSQANAADRITVQSVTFMSTGAPVFVAGAFSYAGNSSCTGAYLRIYRNGSEIVKFVSRCAPGDGGSISGVAIDTPGAGPATYSIVLSAVAGIATSSNRSLFAMEVKR